MAGKATPFGAPIGPPLKPGPRPSRLDATDLTTPPAGYNKDREAPPRLPSLPFTLLFAEGRGWTECTVAQAGFELTM